MDRSQELRAFLKIRIKERYSSVANYCLSAGLDQADISRFLSGKKDWSFIRVFQLMSDLELKIKIVGVKPDQVFLASK